MKINAAQRSTSGSTLIEILIYIGLFGIIMGGVLVSVFNIVEGTDRSRDKSVLEIEGNFVLGKVRWALGGASSLTLPVVGFPEGTLALNRYDTADLLTFTTDTGRVALMRGGGPATALTSDNVAVSNFLVTRIAAAGAPDSIKVEFTLTSKVAKKSEAFSITKYLRQ